MFTLGMECKRLKTVMATARAKNDVKILMEDRRFSNFIKGNTYRCMIKGEDVYLIDEDKYGFQTDLSGFHEDFEILNKED